MKKGSFLYYLFLYGMVLVFMIVLVVSQHIKGGYLFLSETNATGFLANEFSIFLYKNRTFIVGLYILDIVSVVFGPALLVGAFFGIDKLTALIKKKKGVSQEDTENYDKFVNAIGTDLNSTRKFNVEDFRHFRENSKFQNSLKDLFYIYDKGSDETHSYPLVLRRFEKGTKERDAVEYLITFSEKRKSDKALKEASKEKVKTK